MDAFLPAAPGAITRLFAPPAFAASVNPFDNSSGEKRFRDEFTFETLLRGV